MTLSAGLIKWILLGILLVFSFCIDWGNVLQHGSVDLRNRVTGARLLERHLSPYYYKWQERDSTAYLDPSDERRAPISRTTVTPAMLLLHLPLVAIGYRTIQFVWLVVQWLLLIGALLIWFQRCATLQEFWFVALLGIVFTYTAAWRVHSEIGQVYILLLFLFLYWLVFSIDSSKGDSLVVGLLLGFLIALRPPFLLLVPFCLLRRRYQLAGISIGLLAAIGLPTFFNLSCWMDYTSALHTRTSLLYKVGIDIPTSSQSVVPSIEGISTDLFHRVFPVSAGDLSVFHMERRMGVEPLSAPILLGILAGLFFTWLWLWREQPTQNLLTGFAGWIFLADMFLPAPRWSYNDVMILGFLVLVLNQPNKRFLVMFFCTLAIGVGWWAAVLRPPQMWVANLSTILFVIGASSYLIWGRMAKSAISQEQKV